MLYRMAYAEAIAPAGFSVCNGNHRTMKCVTYNVHFGVGMDGQLDLERIASAVRNADIIALQEVSRNNPQNGGIDMVAGLAELLPDHFSVFGAPFGVNIGSHRTEGRAVSVFFEFGNMVLSKTPIIASRSLLLPRTRSDDVLNLQRGALEAIIDTPLGPVRVYSVHLDHISRTERLAQIAFLRDRLFGFAGEGGAVTGLSTLGFPDLPHPDHAIAMGDFNLLPDSDEYAALIGGGEAEVLRDISIPDGLAASDSPTWFDPDGKLEPKRIDYCLATAELAAHAGQARVDADAAGSDHRPVWVEIG